MAKIHHYKAHAEVKQTGHLNLSTLRRLSIKILRERSLLKIQSVFFSGSVRQSLSNFRF